MNRTATTRAYTSCSNSHPLELNTVNFLLAVHCRQQRDPSIGPECLSGSMWARAAYSTDPFRPRLGHIWRHQCILGPTLWHEAKPVVLFRLQPERIPHRPRCLARLHRSLLEGACQGWDQIHPQIRKHRLEGEREHPADGSFKTVSGTSISGHATYGAEADDVCLIPYLVTRICCGQKKSRSFRSLLRP
jgi:hypothetical protein